MPAYQTTSESSTAEIPFIFHKVSKQVQRAPNIFPTNQINYIYYIVLYGIIWYYIVSDPFFPFS